ncbi:MAG TPA: MFS transporter [Thermoanaerobaculia bacterium]|nr:MFS transporter [Thermoanaerobaculia bacterium]
MTSTLRDNLRALPAPAWILFGGTFINRFGSFVMPFLVLYLTRSGYSIAQAGVGVGAYGAGHVLASVLGGHLADRIGRRHTIVLSMFASAAAMLALSQARTYPSILLLTCLAGTAAELYRPASHALLVDLVGPEQSVFAFGMYRFAVNLAFAAGPATAGFLADRSFLFLFVGDAITSVIYGVIALVALPHGLRSYMKNERLGEAVRVAAGNRPFVLLLLATFCITMVDFQMGSTFALHVKAVGLPSRVYGLLISENGLLIIAFELMITVFVQRFRPQPVIALGYLFSGFGFALTGLARTIPALAATVVVWTIGEMLSSPMVVAYVAQIAPEQYRGRYMALLTVMWSFGMVAGPPLGTFLFARNAMLLWLWCGLMGIIAATVLAIQLRRHKTIS